jgi:hypothetical protein
MSSFIGHSLAAFSTYSVEKQPPSPHKIYWLGWLIIIASAPDIDHIIRTLHLRSQHQDIRITHSILLSLLNRKVIDRVPRELTIPILECLEATWQCNIKGKSVDEGVSFAVQDEKSLAKRVVLE